MCCTHSILQAALMSSHPCLKHNYVKALKNGFISMERLPHPNLFPCSEAGFMRHARQSVNGVCSKEFCNSPPPSCSRLVLQRSRFGALVHKQTQRATWWPLQVACPAGGCGFLVAAQHQPFPPPPHTPTHGFSPAGGRRPQVLGSLLQSPAVGVGWGVSFFGS